MQEATVQDPRLDAEARDEHPNGDFSHEARTSDYAGLAKQKETGARSD